METNPDHVWTLSEYEINLSLAKLYGDEFEIHPPHYGCDKRIRVYSECLYWRPTRDWTQLSRYLDKLDIFKQSFEYLNNLVTNENYKEIPNDMKEYQLLICRVALYVSILNKESEK